MTILFRLLGAIILTGTGAFIAEKIAGLEAAWSMFFGLLLWTISFVLEAIEHERP